MAAIRRYDPGQKRDPDGTWGDGIPGQGMPDLDMDGFSLISQVEGSFGDLAMGTDESGDVRFAFHEGHKARAVDLGGDELAALADVLERLVQSRGDLDDDAEQDGVYDDDRFGFDDAHKVELYGSGVIGIVFDAFDPDPYTLLLDPPDEADDEDSDDVQAVLDAMDDVFNELDDDRPGYGGVLAEARRFLRLRAHFATTGTASRTRNPREALMFERYNDFHAPAGSATGGQFTTGGGGPAKKAAAPAGKSATKAARRPARKPDDGTLSYDPNSNNGTGYGSREGDSRVHALQQALNRLGIKDSAGKALRDDGKLGPKTTSAVKALQKRLGLKPDGKVTPALLAQIKSMKSLPATKKRSAAMDFCVRSFGFEFEDRGQRNGDGRTLEGYAAVFNTPTRIAAVGGDFDEVISRGAFTRSIRTRMPVLQFEHGRDPRVGAVPIGSIEDLSEDSQGLHVRATLFDNPVVEPVRQAIAGKAIKGMSFRFNVIDGGDAWQRRSGDIDLRTVGDADVHELGPVVFPAYDSTTVSVRSLLAQLGPEEHRSLLRELAYDLRSLEFEEIGVGPSARSSGDADTTQDAAREEHLSIRQRLDQGALQARGILK